MKQNLSIALLQGWERTAMDTNKLEQQPWRSLRQQAEVSPLFRECQKERLNEMLGKSLKEQTEPDLNKGRKTWGSSVQFELIRESYRTYRHRQVTKNRRVCCFSRTSGGKPRIFHKYNVVEAKVATGHTLPSKLGQPCGVRTLKGFAAGTQS